MNKILLEPNIELMQYLVDQNKRLRSEIKHLIDTGRCIPFNSITSEPDDIILTGSTLPDHVVMPMSASVEALKEYPGVHVNVRLLTPNKNAKQYAYYENGFASKEEITARLVEMHRRMIFELIEEL